MVENSSMMQTYCTHLIQLAAQNSTQMAGATMNSSQTATALIIAKNHYWLIWILCCVALDDCPENKLPREGKKYATKKNGSYTIQVKKVPYCWFLGGEE